MTYEHIEKVESQERPAEAVIYGLNGMDFNFNIHEIVKEEEHLFEYETYRFKDKADYYAWKQEQINQGFVDLFGGN